MYNKKTLRRVASGFACFDLNRTDPYGLREVLIITMLPTMLVVTTTSLESAANMRESGVRLRSMDDYSKVAGN